jgi:hypothetical protein
MSLPTVLPTRTVDPYHFGKVNIGEKIGKGLAKGVGSMANSFERKQEQLRQHFHAVNKIRKINGREFPASHIGAHDYAVSQEAAKTVRGKLSSAEPAAHLQTRGPQNPVRAGYKRTAKRVESSGGTPPSSGPTRQVQGSANSTRSVQFKPYF